MNSYDIDGVIDFGKEYMGLTPLGGDLIVTGRSFEERPETEAMLRKRGLTNRVFYNPLRKAEKTRETSAQHKATVFNQLKYDGRLVVQCHFEDDPVQIAIIKELCPWLVVVFVDSYFVHK